MTSPAPEKAAPRCRHLIVRTESFVVSESRERPNAEPYHLCDAADGAPERFVGLPPFVIREALSGHRLRYPEDCRACGLFQPGEPKVNP